MEKLDVDLFLWLNSFHNSFFDGVMLLVSNKKTWIPLYAAMLIWLFFKENNKIIAKLSLIFLSILLTDQTCSGILKPLLHRLRPCYNEKISQIIHQVGDCGGQFGFASSHAGNSFALAMAWHLLFLQNSKWKSIPFIWAFVVAYSRIYLGVHYPADILVGGLIGIFYSSILYYIFQKFSLNN